MAESIGAAGGGHPSLNLTAEEKAAYGELFKEADPDGFGAVSGDVAVKFFEKTRLPPDVLGQIWQIADTENRGFLTPSGFGVVLRLIGHAQAGRAPGISIAAQPAPLPRFDGLSISGPAVTAQSTGTPSSPTQAGPPVRVPALAPDKVIEYSTLFEKSGAENGMLPGLVAKQIFERARLPNEVLGRIWGLADAQGKGSLDVTEFVIAMHLLASYKSGAMRGVPYTLPPGLQDAASRRPPPRIGGPLRPGSASGVPQSVYAQPTGYNQRPQSPATRQQAGTPLSNQITGDWLINAADKVRFDQIFATVDRQGLGYINGEQAVEFFGNARLPEDTLAQIWDLADINSEGRLDRDEFAVAMYLIRQQRGTKDGRGVLPTALPPALIPPSRRRQPVAPSQPTAPAFENATVTQPRSAAEDLFGLDVLAPSQPAVPQVAQSTGGTDAGPFANPRSPSLSPSVIPPAAASAAASIFKPFEPSSSFGRSLAPQQTGASASGQARSVPQTIAESEDLLGDADPTVSAKLTSETSELGNLSNQVGNLSKQMTELQGNQAQAAQELSQNIQQKRAFEGRLAQLRSAYEKEVKEFKALQEQLSTSKNETKRLQQDMAMIEGSHTDLATQHQQLRTALEADQRENAALKEKIRQLNAENDQLKPQIEKLKGDARQQKGLVAINKKQLATNEAERDRLKAERIAVQKEAEDAKREIEESARQLELSKAEVERAREAVPPAAPVNVQSPLAMPSPAASINSNPFMRRPGPSDVAFSPPLGSPEPTQDTRSAFDNIFGPSFAAETTTAATAPVTSFRTDTPPTITAESTRSVTPQGIEPPAPPSARQITSDALPLRTNLERAESVTSSVRVAPPASRLSPAGTPRAATPTIPVTSEPTVQDSNGDPFQTAGPDEEQESVRNAVHGATPVGEIPGAFPGSETPRVETPVPISNQSATIAVIGAATAATAVGAGATTAAALNNGTGETNSEEKKKEGNNFDEYFGGPAHQRTPSEQVKDFDAAFASMKGPATNGPANVPGQEFPDIQEFDEADSSSDEEAALGFDDDFSAKAATSGTTLASTAAQQANPSSTAAAGKQPEIASALPTHLQGRPTLGSAPSTASSLPGIEQQQSPPTYNDSVPEDNPSHFPREYKGLLPERKDPTSPTVADGGSSNPAPPPAGSPPAYGPEIAKSQDEALGNVATRAAHATSSTAGGFDFDSAFSGMGAAQVEDDDSDDPDGTFGGRNQGAEFDPSFDSPAQSRAATVTSYTNSPAAAHHSVTNGSTATATATSDFNTFSNSTPAPEVSQPKPTSPSISHDWEALFAPLSSSTPVDPAGPTSTAPTTLLSPDVAASTTTSTITGSETPQSGLTPSSAITSQKPGRPQPGRALSTGTEHDDPILKRLTAMGWSRAESLAALEKFDYNIDKAADYLTFRS